MTLRSVPSPSPGALTITLPDPVISRPRRVPAGFMPPPLSKCPKCREPIEPADRIRKVFTGWFHAECAREVVATMDNSNLWLMLAEQVAARPSAFKASEIRAIVRAVVEIAERNEPFHEMNDACGGDTA